MLDSERNDVVGYRRAVHRLRPDTPRWWAPTAVTLVATYGILTGLILVGSPLNAADQWFYDLRLVPTTSHWHLLVEACVFLGQRAPAMLIAGGYAVFRWRRLRSSEPVTTFLTASFLFVATVATFKYSTGRIGPRFTSDAYTAFAGGDIFPSGHVTGAVVMYGFIAMTVPRVHRRLMTTVAIVMSVTVGMGTVALNTHWASDVVGGWINGALVLMIAWMATPGVHRRLQAMIQRRRRPVPQPATSRGHAATAPASATTARDQALPAAQAAPTHTLDVRVVHAHHRGHDRAGLHAPAHAAPTHQTAHCARDHAGAHPADSRHRTTSDARSGERRATQTHRETHRARDRR